MKRHAFLHLSTAIGAMFACHPVAALANTDTMAEAADADETTGIADIVVTAQRRSESLQAVPIAVAALDLNTLTASGVQGTDSLKVAVPSLDIPKNTGSASPFIRGIGSRAIGPGVENPVAVYVDGVYLAAPTSGLLAITNVDRVEVLKGPQGTLFGRNATGGLIQIVTRTPRDTFSGNASLGYGNYDTVTGDAYLTGPLGEGVAANVSGYFKTQGNGFGKNLASGKDVNRVIYDFGFRTKLRMELSDNLTVTFAGDYSKQKTNNTAQRLAIGTDPSFLSGPGAGYAGSPWDIKSEIDPILRYSQGGVSAHIDWDAGPVQIASITAYRRGDYHLLLDPELTATSAIVATVNQYDKQFSQELQVLSPTGSKIQYVLGLYYWYADNGYDPFILHLNSFSPPAPFESAITNSKQITRSFAPYAQATAEVLPDTHLTLGIRYTYEKREESGTTLRFTKAGAPFGGPVTPTVPSITAKKPTWRISLDHSFTPDVLAYASYNRGFKSGGYSIGSLNVAPYRPERIDAYEVGLKSMLLDRKLRFNAAAFLYEYKNVQVNGNVATGIVVTNGAAARDKGFEFDFEARPIPELVLTGGYTFLDTEYTEFPNASINNPFPLGGYRATSGSAKGNDLPFAPHHVFTIGGTWTVPIGSNELAFSANYYHSSGYFGEADNKERQGAYGLLNANVTFSLDNDRFSVSLWGRNLTKAVVNIYPSYVNLTSTSPGFSSQRGYYADPRTYGVTVGTKF